MSNAVCMRRGCGKSCGPKEDSLHPISNRLSTILAKDAQARTGETITRVGFIFPKEAYVRQEGYEAKCDELLIQSRLLTLDLVKERLSLAYTRTDESRMADDITWIMITYAASGNSHLEWFGRPSWPSLWGHHSPCNLQNLLRKDGRRTIRSRSCDGWLTVLRMMIISSRDFLTPAGRTTSVTHYPIRFVIEMKLELNIYGKNYSKIEQYPCGERQPQTLTTLMHKMFKTDRLKAQ